MNWRTTAADKIAVEVCEAGRLINSPFSDKIGDPSHFISYESRDERWGGMKGEADGW